MPKTAYIIMIDGEVDQVCETLSTAQKEYTDLRGMGCKAIIRTCDWREQDAFIEREGLG